MPQHTFTLNGSPVTVDAASAMPMIWVLRDLLGLTGTKASCAIGSCGACTVHVDGVAARSCITPVSAVEGRVVTTIEGLSPTGDHPVQQAWLAEEVTQCGYCVPGQIMAAAALLDANPSPTDADIDVAMGGVLCRCGTYLRIRRAIHRAAGS